MACSAPQARMVAAAASVAAGVALAGCTGAHSPAAGHVQQTVAGQHYVIRSFSLASQQMKVSVPTQPIASTATNIPDVSFEVYTLQRYGSEVYLVAAMHNTGTAATGNISGSLGANLSTDLQGVSLFDPAGLKQYLPYGEPQGANLSVGCLCTDTFSMNPLAGGASFFVAAVYPAPPASVTTVSVITPVGTVPSVPIAG
jgi:hypothetical protein